MNSEATTDIENDTSLQAAEIATQNDLFRKALIDANAAIEMHSKGIQGQVFVTPGVSGEGVSFRLRHWRLWLRMISLTKAMTLMAITHSEQ